MLATIVINKNIIYWKPITFRGTKHVISNSDSGLQDNYRLLLP